MATNPEVDPHTEMEARLASGLRNALGESDIAKILVKKKDLKSDKWQVLQTYEVTDADGYDLVSVLRPDFADGGEFLWSVTGQRGRVVTNGSLNLAPLPNRLRPPAARDDRQESAPRNLDPMVQLMITQMAEDRRRSEDRERRSDERGSRLLEAALATAGLIIPAIFEGRGAKGGESAAELLNLVLEAKNKMQSAEGEDVFERALDRSIKLKQLTEGGGGEGGGLMGSILQAFAPMMATMVQQNMQQASQAQQPGQARPTTAQLPPPAAAVNAPAPAPPGQLPASQMAPAPAPEMSPDQAATMAMYLKYQPVMEGIKTLLSMNMEADTIAAFIDGQVRGGALEADDVTALLNGLVTAPDQFKPTLNAYGINDDSHLLQIAGGLAILHAGIFAEQFVDVAAAYGLNVAGQASLVVRIAGFLASGLDDTAEGDGMGGHEAGATPNGFHGTDGLSNTGNTAEGTGIN